MGSEHFLLNSLLKIFLKRMKPNRIKPIKTQQSNTGLQNKILRNQQELP